MSIFSRKGSLMFDFRTKCVITLRRFIELMISVAALSAVVTLFTRIRLSTSYTVFIISLAIGFVFFLGANIWQMRSCFFDLRNLKLFYTLNLIAYAAFAIVNIAVLLFCPTNVFTWTFLISKTISFIFTDVSEICAVLIFHGIGIVSVLLSTLGMYWLLDITNGEAEE